MTLTAKELSTEKLTLNFGPSHPATHGTLRVHMEVDGEVVTRADAEIGYLHSGFEKLGEQITNCSILAETTGMVVYASTGRRWRRVTIEEGATVRERQDIVSISNPSNMAVQVKIHESAVRKVKPGLKVRIVPDAMKEKAFYGTVKSVSVMPDGQNWMNPDLKVYNTMIEIDKAPEDVKPGMSVQVEIMITKLQNALVTPIQSVTTIGGRRVCFVVRKGKAIRQYVETGMSNTIMIHIVKGLAEGDEVLLHPPMLADAEPETPSDGSSPEDNDMPSTKPDPTKQPDDVNAAGDAVKTEAEPETAPAYEIVPEAAAAIAKMPENRRQRVIALLKTLPPEEQRKKLKEMSNRRPRSGKRGEGRPK